RSTSLSRQYPSLHRSNARTDQSVRQLAYGYCGNHKMPSSHARSARKTPRGVPGRAGCRSSREWPEWCEWSLHYFLGIFHLHIFIDDLTKLPSNIVALQGYGLLTIHENWRHRPLSRAGQAAADVGMLAFAGTIDHASHYRQRHIFHAIVLLAPYQHAVANVALDTFSKLLKIGTGGTPATGAC